MPLVEIDHEPSCMTIEEQTRLQEATPSSFEGHAPVLRLKLDRVRCCIYPEPLFQVGESSRSAHNGNDAPSMVSQGTLWVTDDEVAFLPSSGKGFSLDYPSLSLHAISRSIPPSLTSAIEVSVQSNTASGCLYCQLEDSEEEDEEQTVFPELWILPPEEDLLEPLFEALSYCASLHPSKIDGEDEGGGHPFAGIGPFGTGTTEDAAPDGAFDDAEEASDTDQEAVGFSDTGRATLARLDLLLDQDTLQQGQASFVPATPSSPPASFHSADPRKVSQEASNSLILVHVPKEVFTYPALAASLLDLLYAFGNLASWTPLPSFQRALIVYEEIEGARRAKEALDKLSLPLINEDSTSEEILDETTKIEDTPADALDDSSKNTLRAFYGPMTVVSIPGDGNEDGHLAVPATDRNFLISPPGSPPIGWEPIKEDPPNRETLADDLIRALGSLRDKGLGVHSHQPEALKSDITFDQETEKVLPPPSLIIPPSQARISSRHPLAKGNSQEIISIPGVTVQSMDSEEGEASLDERLNKGMSISSVKATVDSMKGPFALSSPNGKITPTGRPPLA